MIELFKIFQETKRPSKEMQVTIARQLGLDPSTVSNFFMNARRRSVDKWREDSPPGSPTRDHNMSTTTCLTVPGTTRTVYVTNVSATGNTIVQHISGDQDTCDLSPTSLASPNGGHGLDLWQDLSVEEEVSTEDAAPPSHTVYIIPRSLVSSHHDTAPDSPDQVLLDQDPDDDLDNEEILETEEEVLDDEDCCLDPPD